MPDLTLPAFHITKTTRLTVEADYALAQELEQYHAFYRETHGASANESPGLADLVREMARQFMAHDRAFQQFKQAASGTGGRSRSRVRRRAASTPASAPAPPAAAQP